MAKVCNEDGCPSQEYERLLAKYKERCLEVKKCKLIIWGLETRLDEATVLLIEAQELLANQTP